MHPGWDATINYRFLYFYIQFQFMHPGWDATRIGISISIAIRISIHTSRVGCNKTTSIITTGVNTISIHASHTGCNPMIS